jgi:superfamily II DNA or RNA helicase
MWTKDKLSQGVDYWSIYPLQYEYIIIISLTVTLRPHQERALDTMKTNPKGQIIVPTGGGKTMVMIEHARYMFCQNAVPKTIVVVAPRILLANQLCSEFLEHNLDGWHNQSIEVIHCHSGETHFKSSTKTKQLEEWYHNTKKNLIIFTTYHSLHKITNSFDIEVDVAYYDEAHNSVTRRFFEGTQAMSYRSRQSYFFTATPRIAHTHERSMTNTKVYGKRLCNVKAPELIAQGHILPPTIVPFEINTTNRNKVNMHEVDAESVDDIIDTLDDTHASKVLVAVPSSRVLQGMIARTTLLSRLTERGYDTMHITSKFGAIINGKKVSREYFFDTLNLWGKDANKKFVIFHYSILSEGINVHGLTHCILLRNLNVVEMAQTIGRVIRLDKRDATRLQSGELTPCNWSLYNKPTGFITVPVHKGSKRTIKRLQLVVDAIFEKGEPPLSIVR